MQVYEGLLGEIPGKLVRERAIERLNLRRVTASVSG